MRRAVPNVGRGCADVFYRYLQRRGQSLESVLAATAVSVDEVSVRVSVPRRAGGAEERQS